MERAVSVAHIDGGEYRTNAARNMRDESCDAGLDGDGQLVCDIESDFRRTDGTGHWTGRQLATRDGKETGELVAARGGGKGISRSDVRQRSAARWATDAFELGRRFSASVDRRVRAEGFAYGGTGGRRDYSAICRSGADRMVHELRERRSACGGAGSQPHRGDGGRARVGVR